MHCRLYKWMVCYLNLSMFLTMSSATSAIPWQTAGTSGSGACRQSCCSSCAYQAAASLKHSRRSLGFVHPARLGFIRRGVTGNAVVCEAGEVTMAPKKAQMQGTLFQYGPKAVQVAFRNGAFKQQVIFIGGLTDGFFATEYLVPLAKALERESWSLVQFLFSSSYSGYGTSSLKQDASELEQLISYLINEENSQGVILVGHSTGCQDIVYYLRSGGNCSRAVRGAILQAPVSDREYRATLPGTASMIDLADSMIKEGRALDLMPRESNPDAPITAERYRSLTAYMGDEDMFSSDLTDEQLRVRLEHMSRLPCQVIFSMADEYVPEYVDKRTLVKRLCEAMGGAERVEISWGNHSLSNRVEEAVRAMIDFIKREGPKGWDDPWKAH